MRVAKILLRLHRDPCRCGSAYAYSRRSAEVARKDWVQKKDWPVNVDKRNKNKKYATYTDQEVSAMLQISYCGLCGAEKSSGSTVQRTPLSKQPNKHLQTTLIEAAKMAPRYSPQLAMLYDQEKQEGHADRATLAVARKLVAYLMAVDRGQRNFQVVETSTCIAA